MKGFFASGMHWRILNFFLFLGILFYYLRKPVVEFWKRRSEGIVSEMGEAKRLRQDAGKRVLELEARRNRLEKEMKGLIQSLREEGKLEGEKILEKTNLLANRLRESAGRILEQERNRSRERLRREAVEISLMTAERMIQKGIQMKDQQRLTEKFLEELRPNL